MKSLPSLLFTSLLILFVNLSSSAQLTPQVRKAVYFDKTPPLREMKLIKPGKHDRRWEKGEVENEEPERKRTNPNALPTGADPLWQKDFGFRGGNEIVQNFDGMPSLNECYPPDTDGDVGKDYYFQMINLSFQIFDKEGHSLYGPADNRTLWSGFIGPWTGTNDGDPIVIYDEQADRWVATQFAIHTQDGTYWELVAVSQTSDPTGEYYRYAFQFPAFNDYPKLGVWPDGYYFAFNMFGDDYFRGAVCACEREAMLNGNPDARMILFDMPQNSEPASLLPADFDGPQPPAGTPNYFAYMLDDAWGAESDLLSIWALKADWQNPENSTFEEVNRLTTEPFNTHFCDNTLGSCLPQPEGGPGLEVLSDRLMYRLQYRNFGSYQVMLTNHTVNVDGNGHAGIRWYEFRNLNDGNGWFIYQQGTYAPDEFHRWMGSIAMDGRGYIALGFSIVNQNKYASIHYTGRSPNDPLGQMTFYEEEIYGGTGVQGGSPARWGDYSMMSVDPSNDTTFWFTTEYVKTSGTITWRTRIASFNMVEDHVAPDDVIDLTATANTTNSVTLQWTATGDNGADGTAFLYDLRYSTNPITDENFETTEQIEKVPAPSEAGTVETFTVKDLEFSQHFYFALKVRDRQFNFSGLSNVVQATTPAEPQVEFSDNTLVQKIFPGSAGTRPFTIHNNGGSDLYYEVHKDTASAPQRPMNYGDYADRSRKADPKVTRMLKLQVMKDNREAGDILGIYPGGATAISGIAAVDNVLYMTDMQKNYLLRYDTTLRMVTDTAIIHANPYSIAWDGKYLWIGDQAGNFFAYNLDGTSAGFSFSGPYEGVSTLSWDGNYFVTNFILENNPVISQIDETGAVVSSFRASLNNMKIWQLAYVPAHHAGHFWFTNNSGKIGEVSENEDGTGSIVRLFTAPASASYALCHDKADLWYGKLGGTLYKIDDGIDEINWLKVTPEKGVIAASGQFDLSLLFDAGRFGEGDYKADMTVLTNDPAIPEIVVPVDLKVTHISLGSDTSFCGNLSVALDAGDGFAGYLWSDGSTGQFNTIDSAGYGTGIKDIWVDVTDIGGTVKRDSVSVNFLDCTSIFEFPSGLKISVFPNPNHGQFTVKSEGKSDKIKCSLIDMQGVVISEKEMESPGETFFDISNQPKGQYILRIETGKEINIQKVLFR
jgi:hypothetical protein